VLTFVENRYILVNVASLLSGLRQQRNAVKSNSLSTFDTTLTNENK